MSNLIAKTIIPIDDALPVSAEDVRADLRIDYPISDGLIESYIKSSINKLQELTSLVFQPSNVKTIYKQYGCGDQITLGYCNEMDPVTVTGIPDDGELDGAGEQWYLETRAGKVTLEYEAGYAVLPDQLKQAVILDVAWRLEHYGDDIAAQISPEALNLIQPFKAYIPL